MPQIGAIASGENCCTFSASASYPDVRSRMNAVVDEALFDDDVKHAR